MRRLLILKVFVPIFRAWAKQAFILKRLNLADMSAKAEFVGESHTHIQPKEQAASDHQRLADHLVSHSEIIRERGGDPDEVFAEIEKDAARLAKIGGGGGDSGSADE